MIWIGIVIGLVLGVALMTYLGRKATEYAVGKGLNW